MDPLEGETVREHWTVICGNSFGKRVQPERDNTELSGQLLVPISVADLHTEGLTHTAGVYE